MNKFVILKKSKIRGEESSGMLCSEKELTLSNCHDGIIELPNTSKIGLSISESLDAAVVTTKRTHEWYRHVLLRQLLQSRT